jgi:tetratricopeptide (TPR) repeat protein
MTASPRITVGSSRERTGLRVFHDASSARTMVSAGLVWLAIVGGALAQPRPESLPPGPGVGVAVLRNLSGDDANRVEALEKTIDELQRQGRFAEAVVPAREVLAHRARLQGDDHWQTIDARIEVRTCERMAGLSHAHQTALAKALLQKDQAVDLGRVGRYSEAEPLFRTIEEVSRQVLGQDHPDTAASVYNLAQILQARGKYAEAEPLYWQSLAIRLQTLGVDHPRTANSYVNTGGNLDAQGKYAEAEPLLETGLAIRLRTLGEDHPDTAWAYNNLAGNRVSLRKHAEAEPLFKAALAIWRRTLGEDYPDMAWSYNGLATILCDQGKSTEAEPLLRKASAILRARLAEDHPVVALRDHNLAANLYAQGTYAEAESLDRKALVASRRALGEDHPDTAMISSKLAASLYAQGRFIEAEATAIAAAQSYAAARVRVSFRGLDRAEFAAREPPSFLLAAILARRNERSRAWQWLETSKARGLLDDLSRSLEPIERRRLNDLNSRLQRLDEQIMVLLGAEDRRENRRIQVDRLALQRDALSAELSQFELSLTRKHGPVAGQVFELRRIQAQLPADAAMVGWLDLETRPNAVDPRWDHWACVVRRRGEPAWVRINGSGPGGAWTANDDQRPDRVRAALSRRPDDTAGSWRDLTARVAQQRLAPLQPYLTGEGALPAVNHLIVLPSATLADLPIEVLVESLPDGPPKYVVSYAPSGTIFAWLRERPRRVVDTPRLLALGDPIFTAPTAVAPPSPESSRGQRALATLRSRSRGETPQPLPDTRREVQAIADLFDRPETMLGSEASEQRLDEINRTGRLRQFDFLHLATHGKLDRQVALRSALLLARDRLPDPMRRILDGEPIYDGELTAEQIIRTWTLDAELVTLSACQTALGRQVGGEGYLGFSQALFLAGARSVVLSLWNVDDLATALLMTRFYQSLLGRRPDLDRPLAKAEALAEAKTWLRTRTGAEVAGLCAGLPATQRSEKVPGPSRSAAKANHPYEHPYYWAAFILIGDPT